MFSLMFAGVWSYVWHWGPAAGLLMLCLLGAYGTRLIAMVPGIGPWLSQALAPLRTDLLWVALGLALFMGGMFVGNHDGAKRCQAKTIIIEKQVKAAVDRARSRPRRDPYDSEDN